MAMEKFNAKEFITKIRNRKFDPSIWVGKSKSQDMNISIDDYIFREIDYLRGLVNYQANIIDDIMFSLIRMEENKENIIDDSIENAKLLLREGGYLEEDECQ